MPDRPRLYDNILREYLRGNRRMALVSGPRQVGKTTTCRALSLSDFYLNWDKPEDRVMRKGIDDILSALKKELVRSPFIARSVAYAGD